MAETAPTPPRRRDTASSLASQASNKLRRRDTKPWPSSKASSSRKTCQERYPSYRLKWDKIKVWLETRYPELQFTPKNLLLVDDKYVFEVPVGEKLTQTEKDDIAKLKDQQTAVVVEPRRAVTPEIPPQSDSEEEE